VPEKVTAMQALDEYNVSLQPRWRSCAWVARQWDACFGERVRRDDGGHIIKNPVLLDGKVAVILCKHGIEYNNDFFQRCTEEQMAELMDLTVQAWDGLIPYQELKEFQKRYTFNCGYICECNGCGHIATRISASGKRKPPKCPSCDLPLAVRKLTRDESSRRHEYCGPRRAYGEY
jgi:hypothetical protein